MIFTEARFFLFLAVVYAVHWSLRAYSARKLWLLSASLLFYGVCGIGFLALMIGTALVDYVAGLLLGATEDARRRRFILIASLVSNLGVLVAFKYAGFFARSVQEGLALLGFHADIGVIEIALPVGISFYTFQSLSYTIDVYRRHMAPVRSCSDFLLFVTFFPQLVAGPIVRATDFLPQLESPRSAASVRLRACAVLFLVGYVKKACVADHVSESIDPVFADPASYAAADLRLALVLYAIQIYCDFSGYTDMAIACAGLFGFRLTQNFDAPYMAASVTDFWRRWHISLSTWFRDYLYIPLGGNRHGAARTIRNLLVVFFLCGLWHGAAWTFVAWGLLHGAALVLERMGLGRALDRLPKAFGRAWMLLVVLVGWALFRATSFGDAATVLRGTLGAAAPVEAALPSQWWILVALFICLHALAAKKKIPAALWTMPRWAFAVLFAVAVALMLPWVAVGYAPFIYFQF